MIRFKMATFRFVITVSLELLGLEQSHSLSPDDSLSLVVFDNAIDVFKHAMIWNTEKTLLKVWLSQEETAMPNFWNSWANLKQKT